MQNKEIDKIVHRPGKKSIFEAVSAKFFKVAKEKKITLGDLLRDLKKVRQQRM